MKALILLVILFLQFPVFAQQAQTGKDCLKDHPTVWDFYNSIRMLPFVKIVSADKETQILSYRFEERTQIVLGTLHLVRDGIYEKDFADDQDSYFRLYFCEKHQIAWIIERMKPALSAIY